MIQDEKYVIEWDIETWKTAFIYWEKHVPWEKISLALEIGSRRGGPSWWIANKGIKIECTDRKDIFTNAKLEHEKRGGSSLISYSDLDVLELSEIEKYDLIICKSVLGGVGYNKKNENIKEAIERIHASLKPGGIFLFAENLVSSPLHILLRKKMTKWGSGWNYLTTEQLEEYFQMFSKHQILSTGFLSTFGRTEIQRKKLSKIDEFFSVIIPKKWNYLGYGIAIK